jgi:DNA-binding transcriptional LysR family regulator
MTVRQFEHFLKIVQCGSINKAALQLSLTQQSLQSSINSLEKQLGFTVFVRSRTGISLTPQGEEILNDIQQIMDIVEGWKRLEDDSARKVIRIAGTISMINLVMGKLVIHFKKKYPNVALEIHEARRQEAVNLVRQEAMVGIFGAVPPAEIELTRELLLKDNRTLEIMGKDDYVVFINSAHPLAKTKQIKLSQLAQFTAALYPQDDHKFCYSEIFSFFSKNTTPYYASKQENLLKLVGRDQSIAAVFPGSAIYNPNLETDRLATLPVSDFPMPGLNCLAYPKMETLSPIEEELILQIRKLFAKPID